MMPIVQCECKGYWEGIICQTCRGSGFRPATPLEMLAAATSSPAHIDHASGATGVGVGASREALCPEDAQATQDALAIAAAERDMIEAAVGWHVSNRSYISGQNLWQCAAYLIHLRGARDGGEG